MKKHVALLLLPLSMVSALPAFADDSEVLLDRNKMLDSMTYRAEQLKLQAAMAESYKKMADAGFIVDESGKPLGVDNLAELGEDVRKKGGKSDAAPTDPYDPVIRGTPPWGMDQPAFGPVNPEQGPMTASNGAMQGGGAGGSEDGGKADDDEERQFLALTEVRANSVMVRTNDGIQEVKIGQKVYDMKLQKFDVDTAYFSGPNGTKVVKIDWTTSKRYADD